MSKRSFTLLEVMVALALILIAGGFAGWKMHQAVCKKRFQSELSRLQSRLLTCQRLATAMQCDWKGVLSKKGSEWNFETVCIESLDAKKMKPLQLHSFDLFYNGKKTEFLEIDFFSSGQTDPDGSLLFVQEEQKSEMRFPELFQRESSGNSKKKGPPFPNPVK